MVADTGFSRQTVSERYPQPVAIISVDPASRTAVGMTRIRATIQINCAYATGDTITVPAVGEQWYVERFDLEWRLYGRIPHNDATLHIEPEEGQVSVGSASGPLELNGSEVRANGVFRLNSYYYRDNGVTLQRSSDGVTWTSISAVAENATAIVDATTSVVTTQIADYLADPLSSQNPSLDGFVNGINTMIATSTSVQDLGTQTQGIVDQIQQSVQGGTSSGHSLNSVVDNLKLAWSSFWDGLTNNISSTSTSKLPSEVRTAAAGLQISTTNAFSAASLAQSNTGTLVDHVTNAFTGRTVESGRTLADALAALQQTYQQLGSHSRSIQYLLGSRDQSSNRGILTSVDFGTYGDQSGIPGFTTTYSGSGSSTLGISGGQACWVGTSNNNKDGKAVSDTPSATDFQVLRGTMTTPPESAIGGMAPRFWALGRISADGTSFTWARTYATSTWLQYRGEVGCTTEGVEHVWATNIPLTWSLDMEFHLGVGTDPHQYQVFSGDRLVWTHSETGTNSTTGTSSTSTFDSLVGDTWRVSATGSSTLTFMGTTTSSIPSSSSAATVRDALTGLGHGTWSISKPSTSSGIWYLSPPPSAPTAEVLTVSGSATLSRDNYRSWGSIAEIRSGTYGPRTSGRLGGCSISDNLPPTVSGSTARMTRVNSTDRWDFPMGDTVLGSLFWENISYESPDVNADTSDGTFTVTTAKPYVVNARIELYGGIGQTPAQIVLQVCPSGGSWADAQLGTTGEIATGRGLVGSWTQYLNPGDKVRILARNGGLLGSSYTITGVSGGTGTYFTIAGVG